MKTVFEKVKWGQEIIEQLLVQPYADLDFTNTFQCKALATPASGEALRKGNKDITEAEVEDACLTGLKAAVVADDNVIGGLPVIHRIDITAGALGDTDVTLTHKTRVIDVWFILRGAGVATTTFQVKSTASVITDAMDASGSDKALVRAAEIDDANHEVAAGGILRITSATGATQPDATVYVLGIRIT